MPIDRVSHVNVNEVVRPASRSEVSSADIKIAEEKPKIGDLKGKEEPRREGASEQYIKTAINVANKKMHRTTCEFSYHEETKRVSIKVLDKETNEVIREIPPEETLEMVQKMWELAGILVDERR